MLGGILCLFVAGGTSRLGSTLKRCHCTGWSESLVSEAVSSVSVTVDLESPSVETGCSGTKGLAGCLVHIQLDTDLSLGLEFSFRVEDIKQCFEPLGIHRFLAAFGKREEV